MLKAGRPDVTSTSTDTSAASIPITAAENTRASMAWIVGGPPQMVNVQNQIQQFLNPPVRAVLSLAHLSTLLPARLSEVPAGKKCSPDQAEMQISERP